MCSLKSSRQAKQHKYYIFSCGGQIDNLSCSCSRLCSWSTATDFRIMLSTVMYAHICVAFLLPKSLCHLTSPSKALPSDHHPHLADKEIKP